MKNTSKKFTLEKTEIPSALSDSIAIKDFLSTNKGKRVVVVQGLGFVGAVMALVCANGVSEEYAVIGVDLADEKNFHKIKSINEGVFPLTANDPKIDEFYNKAMSRGNLLATYDPIAYGFADVIIVDVNLDVEKSSSQKGALKDFDVDLSCFKSAINTIASNCSENVLVLVETTVPPGTCEKVVKPILDKQLIERGLKIDRYKLGHSYERVMPGPDYIDSIRNYPRVFSGINEASASAVECFLKTIINCDLASLTQLESTTATEMAKVLENSYRSTNIAFAVEWSRFAEEAGVDLYAMVNAIRIRKTHSNLMFPNIGVGGYCLTKDPLLASWARKEFFKSEGLRMSEDSVSTNDQMPIYAYQRLKSVFGELRDLSIAFFGVSYRSGVGDTRFTPVETLYKLITTDSEKIKLHDPFVKNWEEQNTEVSNDINQVLKGNLDLIIFSTAHTQYKSDNFIMKIMKLSHCKIFDSVGLLSNEQIIELSTKHKVSVLGRGDIT